MSHLEHVKTLLRNGESVLGAALNAGLPGPGRLHDLCVLLDAASPGEMKSGGTRIEIKYGFAATPFGEALIGETSRGISHLSFVGWSRPQRREGPSRHSVAGREIAPHRSARERIIGE